MIKPVYICWYCRDATYSKHICDKCGKTLFLNENDKKQRTQAKEKDWDKLNS